MMLRATAVLLCAFALQASAQGGADVDGALERLEAAEARLSAAVGSYAQRQALSEAIRAYEAALSSLSEMQVSVGQEVRARERELVTEQADLQRRLAGLARLGLAADAVLILRNNLPEEAARSSLVLQRLAMQTRTQVAGLRTERDALAALAAEQEDLAGRMTLTRSRLGEYRDDLIARVEDAQAEAGTLPDIGAEALALATLAIALESTLPIAPPEGFPLARGSLAAPIEGALLRGFGDADPAGLSRPGLTFVAPPGALVTAPAQATVRFVGRIDGYGAVTVLEPASGILLILAGFGTLLSSQGETVSKGAPLGFLPEAEDHEEFSDAAEEITGQPSAKTLYIELRYDQAPVDPTPWFAE